MVCEAWQNPTSCCSSNLIFSHFLLIQTYWLPYWSLSMAKDAPDTGPLPLFSHPPGTLSRYSYALHSHSILVSYLITPLLRCLLLLRLLSLIILYPFSLLCFSSQYTPLYIYLFVHLLLLFWMYHYESVSVLFTTDFPLPRTVLHTNRYSNFCWINRWISLSF